MAYITIEEARELLPRVGDKRMEVPTTAEKGDGEPRRCTVVKVHTEHLWYMVEFENGVRETYKVPQGHYGPFGGVQK